MEELLPHGKPLTQEREMWDYKSQLPPYPAPPNQTEEEKKDHAFEVASLIKDVVSFYNSYGGYLIIGVSDSPREIVGFSGDFDCDKFNRQVEGVVKQLIECIFVYHEIHAGAEIKTLGLLFIPQRPDNVVPKHLVKAPPTNSRGKAAYQKDTVYLRKGDECKPVSTTEDYVFLIAQGKRQVVDEAAPLVVSLTNNLRGRDPGFIKFIGREGYLQQLWVWLSDNYSPGKLLAGVGGVGKTTIVREFAEDIVRMPPHGLEYVMWFSAKQRYYIAASANYINTERIDFKDTESLLKAILQEYGYSPSEIKEEWSRVELEEEVIESLRTIPALIVVDDVDSLMVEEQNDVLHTMLKIVGRTFDRYSSSSRVIFTARLTLGVPKSQYLEVLGLDFDEFAEYVEMTAQQMGMDWNLVRNSRLYR
ncbi:MAG: putative DNA binding domain-containing protein, partial [Acidobacteria bacterium]|nr:putative DNA binding domain-containing protein [Acidobacteriota bacterium]